MRGKVESYGNVVWLFGITPAYAGKSRHFIVNNKSDRDHPRVCGEKVWRGLSWAVLRGSPPRMRGKAFDLYTRQRAQGITPAYAGKSARCVLLRKRLQDHPRVCGEKCCRFWHLCYGSGSPPRMRGKAHKEEIWKDGYRITPAYAGKSSLYFFSRMLLKDHPRVCGEKYAQSYLKHWRRGSPPRMRGKVASSCRIS